MKRVAVIGGGVAGMQTALRLAEQGVEPVIIEKEAELGGMLRGWHVLFPSFTPASEILTELRRRIAERGIEVMTPRKSRVPAAKGFSSRTGVCWHAIRSWSARASRFSMPRSRRNTATASTTTSLRRSTSSGCSTKAAWPGPTARAPGASPSCTAWVARREGLPAALLEGMLHHGGEAGHGDAADVSRGRRVQFLHGYPHVRPRLRGDVPRGTAEIQHSFHPRTHFGGQPDDRRTRTDQGRGYPHGTSAAHERRHADPDRGHACQRRQRRFCRGGRAEPCAERLHGAARHVPRQREEQCRGYFL